MEITAMLTSFCRYAELVITSTVLLAIAIIVFAMLQSVRL
jgi:hypothetical protein